MSNLASWATRESPLPVRAGHDLPSVMVWLVGLFSLLFAALWLVKPVSAQEVLTLDENTLGEVSADNPLPTYTFTSPANTPVTITARSLTAGFAPVILLLDEDGRLLERVRNPVGLARRTLRFTPTAAATYTVQILGADQTYGRFVISITPAQVAPGEPVLLELGQPFRDRIDAAQPLKLYQFSSTPGSPLVVQVVSELADGGAAVILSDDAGTPLGTLSGSLRGGTFIVPAGVGVNYWLTLIHSGAERTEAYTITITPLTPTTAAVTPIPTPISGAQVTIPPGGPCTLATATEEAVNIRRGPGADYERITGLRPNVLVPVTGRTPDFAWWQIEYQPGLFGWVSDSVVRRGGDCSTVGEVEFPAP